MNKLDIQNFDLVSFFDQKKTFYDKIPLSQFKRLMSFQCESSPEVEFILDGIVKNGIKTLEISLKATLKLNCERCLRDYEYKLNLKSSYPVVLKTSLSEKHKINEIEIILNSHFNLFEFIEDEILLDIPFSPKHANEDECVKLN
jgi:uncharacterized protein